MFNSDEVYYNVYISCNGIFIYCKTMLLFSFLSNSC